METKQLTADQFEQTDQADGSFNLIYKQGEEVFELLRVSIPEIELKEKALYKIEVLIPEDDKISCNVFYSDKSDCLTEYFEIMTTDPRSISLLEYHLKQKSHLAIFLRDVFHCLIVPAIKKL